MAGPHPIYLDYNATAPLLPAALEAMTAALRDLPGNPSSPHGAGRAARDALEAARAGLARLLGCSRREVYFTSGGSESNAWVFRAQAGLPRPLHVITSPIEHPSVLRCCEWLQGQGVAVSYLPVDGAGAVRVEALGSLFRPETRLVSVMAANNETGVVQPLRALAEEARRLAAGRPVLLHTDAVQAFGRIPLAAWEWGYGAVTIAAHKLGGPKGIGALALGAGVDLPGLILGGRQERGRRAGTESVALALGFAAAAEWACARQDDTAARLRGLRDGLIARLAGAEGFFVHGAGAERLPNTACLGFEGVSAQSLLVALDLDGVAVSTGSACSSGAVEPSHVLRAMGVPAARLASALRVSLGWGTAEAELGRCAELLLANAARLRGQRTVRAAAG